METFPNNSQNVLFSIQFSSVHSLSCVWLFATPWIAARQASLFITNSRTSLKLMSIELVLLSSHLILCRPLLLLPPIPPSIRVFSNESTLRMRFNIFQNLVPYSLILQSPLKNYRLTVSIIFKVSGDSLPMATYHHRKVIDLEQFFFF